MDIFFKIVTQFGGLFVVIVMLVICLLVGTKYFLRYGFVFACSYIITFSLKLVVARPRPDVTLAKIRETGYSFPSAHSVVAALSALFALYLIFKVVRRVHFRILCGAGFGVMVCLVAYSRVYLGVHYWSDVICGVLFGTGSYFLFAFLYDRYVVRHKFIQRLCAFNVMGGVLAGEKCFCGGEVRCKSLKQTRRLARRFAGFIVKHKQKTGRAVVLFHGELGAGKTAFISAVIAKIDKSAKVSSPTFTIINQYTDEIYHIDLYRVEDERELVNTDFEGVVGGGNFVFIEWAERCSVAGDFVVSISVKESGERVFSFSN